MDAAAALFYTHGFHEVGLDRIIEEVGVTKTTFYNHFESKDDLIIAVLVDRDERDIQALRDALRQRASGARERALLVFDILDEWFHDEDFNGCLFVNAAAQFPNPNDPIRSAAMNHGERVRQEFESLADELGAEDPAMLSKQLCMLVSAALTSRHVDGDLDAARTARLIADQLLPRS